MKIVVRDDGPKHCEACGERMTVQRRRSLSVMACPTHGEWTPNEFIFQRGKLYRLVLSREDYERNMAMCRAINLEPAT